MKGGQFRLTRAADADIILILRETVRVFGPQQRNRYSELIAASIRMVADMPHRPGSRDCSDIREGLRSFHIDLAAGRRGAAAHKVFYKPGSPGEPVTIVRILHDKMEPGFHIDEKDRA